jgi:hypothetical protein
MTCHFEVGNISGKGSCAISALFHFSTIRIEYSVTEVDACFFGFFDNENLVCSDSETSVSYKPELCRCKVDVLIATVEYDKVVSRAVHFCEF